MGEKGGARSPSSTGLGLGFRGYGFQGWGVRVQDFRVRAAIPTYSNTITISVLTIYGLLEGPHPRDIGVIK